MIPLYLACFICGLTCLMATDNQQKVKEMHVKMYLIITAQVFFFMTTFGLMGILWTLAKWYIR